MNHSITDPVVNCILTLVIFQKIFLKTLTALLKMVCHHQQTITWLTVPAGDWCQERRVLLMHSITNPIQQFDAARQIVKKGLSVRETEQLVRRIMTGQGVPKKSAASAPPSADIRRLEKEISEKLGAKVHLDHSGKGFGKLIISYHSLDELDGILRHIK